MIILGLPAKHQIFQPNHFWSLINICPCFTVENKSLNISEGPGGTRSLSASQPVNIKIASNNEIVNWDHFGNEIVKYEKKGKCYHRQWQKNIYYNDCEKDLQLVIILKQDVIISKQNKSLNRALRLVLSPKVARGTNF